MLIFVGWYNAVASLADKAARLQRRQWKDINEFAHELLLMFRGEDGTTTSSTSTSSTTASSSPDPISGSTDTKAFVLASPHYDKDYIRCTDPEGETVYLAKPFLFRPSTWQGQIYTLNNVYLGTRFCNLTITHSTLTADENQRKVKTRSQLVSTPSDIIETVFTESILPFYKVGDTLYGQRLAAGLGITGGDGNDIEWLDLNVDGRTWRADASLQVS